MSKQRLGVRHWDSRNYVVVALLALHAAACGGNTSVEQASGGAGGSSDGGLFEPRCNTRDDGAEVLADNYVGVYGVGLDATHLYHAAYEEMEPGTFKNGIHKMALKAGRSRSLPSARAHLLVSRSVKSMCGGRPIRHWIP